MPLPLLPWCECVLGSTMAELRLPLEEGRFEFWFPIGLRKRVRVMLLAVRGWGVGQRQQRDKIEEKKKKKKEWAKDRRQRPSQFT